MIEDKDYYKIGNINDIVLSHSSFSHLLPVQGGSPLKFKAFFEEQKEIKSVNLFRGTTFHNWAEDPKAFMVADVDKPNLKLGEVADAMIDTYQILDECDQIKTFEFPEPLLIGACRAVGWNPKWGDDAIIKNAGKEVLPFFKEYLTAENKGQIYLGKSDKVVIENCITSLKQNKTANELLFYKDDFSDKEYYKEHVIRWEENYKGKMYPFKCMIDDLEIDHEKKLIKESDLKTTSKCAYQFGESFVNYHYGRQHHIYARAIRASRPDLKDYKIEYRNVVVETTGLFQTVVYKWHPNIIYNFMTEFDECLERVKHAIENKFSGSLEETLGNGEIKILELMP